jgi:hypothetical protein
MRQAQPKIQDGFRLKDPRADGIDDAIRPNSEYEVRSLAFYIRD